MHLRGFKQRGAGTKSNGISVGGLNRWQARVANGISLREFLLTTGALSNELSFKSLAVEEVRISWGMGLADLEEWN